MVASIIAAVPAAAAAQQDVFSDVTEGVHKPAIDILGEMGLFEGTLCGEGMFCPGEPIKRSDMAVWLIRALGDEELPPAGTTRFADVDADQWWAPYVERLAELEITVGCSQEPLRYCPDASVSRGQMASFLVRAFDLEPAEPAGFVDTEGSVHEADIDALAASGITGGCKRDPLQYCTSDPSRRSHMATFLARALGLVQSPAHPAQQDVFSDVTEGVHKPAINILGETGLFEGTLCGEGMFCPGEPIKRSDMAVWLIRALGDEELPPAGTTRFADVDADQWWAPYVERLAELEITVGCSQEPLRYCPDTSVSRGQMASILVQAFDLEPAEPAGFVDTEGSVHEADIDALAASGITGGCKRDPLQYCTSDPSRRSHMATFLARALGLVQSPAHPAQQDVFSDVTEGVHKPAINILGETGLFEGTLCGEGMFCPGEPIKRSDMAVWLIRALGDEELPPAGTTRFADVDADQWWAPYVERLAELEITVGCSQEPLRYCPDTSVSRGQMASILVQAFDLEPAEPAGFVDTEGSVHEADIDALAASGITGGCKRDPLQYCTSDPSRRSHMATFLIRALALVQAPTPAPFEFRHWDHQALIDLPLWAHCPAEVWPSGLIDLLDGFDITWAGWDTEATEVDGRMIATGWMTDEQIGRWLPGSGITAEQAQADLTYVEQSDSVTFWAGDVTMHWQDTPDLLPDLGNALRFRNLPRSTFEAQLAATRFGVDGSGAWPSDVRFEYLLTDWVRFRYAQPPTTMEPVAWPLRSLFEARESTCVGEALIAMCASDETPPVVLRSQHPIGRVLRSLACAE